MQCNAMETGVAQSTLCFFFLPLSSFSVLIKLNATTCIFADTAVKIKHKRRFKTKTKVTQYRPIQMMESYEKSKFHTNNK